MQLREEKIDLENALEAESELHVNRLTRELSSLRLAQQQAQLNGSGNGNISESPETRMGMQMFMNGSHPTTPSSDAMLEAMRRENEHLRNRLVDTERDYVRISRLNEIYREELIDHRRRVRTIRYDVNLWMLTMKLAWNIRRQSDRFIFC